VEQQSTLKTRSLCLPLVSDNPWEKGANEAAEIELAVLEDMGLATAPAAGVHDHQKYLNTTTQYERQIAYLRELLNHTFLRAVYHTSSRQARLEYKEIQEAFLNKNATRAANQVKKFTAQNIIDYILANCVCQERFCSHSSHIIQHYLTLDDIESQLITFQLTLDNICPTFSLQHFSNFFQHLIHI
jgi:hypothetical protein